MAPFYAIFVVLLGAGAGGVGVRGDVALETDTVFYLRRSLAGLGPFCDVLVDVGVI